MAWLSWTIDIGLRDSWGHGWAQAMCEMLTIVGKKVEEMTKSKQRIEGYFAVLERWSKSKALPSRTKFLIRDILDLRRSKWVPRRQKDQARRPHPPKSYSESACQEFL